MLGPFKFCLFFVVVVIEIVSKQQEASTNIISQHESTCIYKINVVLLISLKFLASLILTVFSP